MTGRINTLRYSDIFWWNEL